MQPPIATITLRCPNCSSNLNVSPQMQDFACGYCGSQQHIVRSGGTVSLQLGEALAKVQRGTDRTASELAVVRLKGEIERLKNDLEFREFQAKGRGDGIPRGKWFLWFCVTLAVFLFWDDHPFLGCALLLSGIASRRTESPSIPNTDHNKGLKDRISELEKRLLAEQQVLEE